MVDPDREPLEGVVEVDQAEIAFREGDTFFEPGNAGKILVIGAVEIIERDTNQAKPRRKHAKYLDRRSGRIRLAMISDIPPPRSKLRVALDDFDSPDDEDFAGVSGFEECIALRKAISA